MIMQAQAGESIYSAIERAKEEASIVSYGYVDLVFNQIPLRVSYDSCIDDILTIYSLKCRIRGLELGYRS